jgi:transcriptional regulator with XRE-family HTH domain
MAKGVVLERTLGDRLRKAREHAGLDQQLMAKVFGVTSGTISNWQRGRGYPRGDQGEICEKWSKLTGVGAEWLIFGERSNPSKQQLADLVHQYGRDDCAPVAQTYSPPPPYTSFQVPPSFPGPQPDCSQPPPHRPRSCGPT